MKVLSSLVTVSSIGKLTKSKIIRGTTSGRWYKARILSQEGAICVIDTGSTVLRVKQAKLRKGKYANDVAELRESDQCSPATSALTRERPYVPDGQSQ